MGNKTRKLGLVGSVLSAVALAFWGIALTGCDGINVCKKDAQINLYNLPKEFHGKKLEACYIPTSGNVNYVRLADDFGDYEVVQKKDGTVIIEGNFDYSIDPLYGWDLGTNGACDFACDATREGKIILKNGEKKK